MNKAFEKILERLDEASVLRANSKEYFNNPQNGEYVDDVVLLKDAIKIVNEVAEESQILEDMERSSDSLEDVLNELRKNDRNGWIPCSKRLPGGAINVFATLVSKTGAYTDVLFYYENQWMYERTNSPVTVAKVIAWRPTPEPYKERE